jgi:hypothetical protein
MTKKQSHHPWRWLNSVKPWYFLVLAVIFGLISVYSLRQNNLTMVRLRDKVYQADQSNGDTEGSLRNLREYVYAHMNTDLTSGNNGIYPPIQLKYSYDRALQAIKGASGDQNSQIYTDAQNQCEKDHPLGYYGAGRIPCIQAYIASHGIQTAGATPSASLYEFDFVAPRWSPDVAGFSLLATFLFTVLFAIRWISDRWLKADLRD